MPVGKVLEQKTDAKTLGFYVGIAAIGFFIGTTIAKIQAQDEMQKRQHEFALDEVQGLRNDMNREVLLLNKRIDELKNGK